MPCSCISLLRQLPVPAQHCSPTLPCLRVSLLLQLSVSVQASKAGIIEPQELERRCQAVQSFFLEHLKLEPMDIDRSFIKYLVGCV